MPTADRPAVLVVASEFGPPALVLSHEGSDVVLVVLLVVLPLLPLLSLFFFSHGKRLLEGHPHLIGLFSLGRRVGALALSFGAQQFEISVLCCLYDVTVSVLSEVDEQIDQLLRYVRLT